MPRNKYQIVLRRNPTGKTETAENGQKIRAMGPYNKKSDAVKDAKALPVQTGIAVLVEPVPAAKNFRSASKLVGSLSRRMAKKPKRRKTTGPSRGIKGGYVSNPRGAMDVHRQAHQMAADIADATQKAMMKAPYRKLHLGFVPSQHDGKRITKAGTIYIQDEDAKTPAGYQYIMPIPGNLRWLATRYQLVNRLREITGKLPVLGERGGKPKIVVQVTGLKKNPRSRAGTISNPRATLTSGQTITITGETARGTTKSLTLTVWRVYADGRALCKSASGTLYLWNPVPGILTTTAGKRRRIIIHGVASFARKKNPRSRAGIISNPRKLWKRVGVIRIYRDSEWDEYIVKDSEGGTYHTDDKEDALATARRMNTARKNPRRHKGPSTHVHRRKRSHGGPGITSNPRKDGWEPTNQKSSYKKGHAYITKERVMSRGRRVSKWALYRFDDTVAAKWRLQGHYPTLAAAKAAEDGPIGGAAFLGAPQRRRNPRSRSGYMTKAQFTSFFRSEVWPSIKHLDPTTRRTTWNDMVDSFEKDGTIDPRADWTQPDWVGAHRRRHRR